MYEPLHGDDEQLSRKSAGCRRASFMVTVLAFIGVVIIAIISSLQRQESPSSSTMADTSAMTRTMTSETTDPFRCATHVDPRATIETCRLYHNLKKKLPNKTLFGHQDTVVDGVHWDPDDVDYDVDEKSDVFDVTGDMPAVYGWDLAWERGGINATGQLQISRRNIDQVPYHNIKRWVRRAHENGSINTFSMHLNNPVADCNIRRGAEAVPLTNQPGPNRGDPNCGLAKTAWFRDQPTEACHHILPRRKYHERFLMYLDVVADFFLDLKDADGKYIPIIFRPFHEYNHEWSWWGVTHCSEEDFLRLWRMTIRHLRDKRGIHHLLYVAAPQDAWDEKMYMTRYPGDEWCDILGLDWYKLSASDGQWEDLGKTLVMLAELAQKKNKVYALTEVGFQYTVPSGTWWTQHLLPAIGMKYAWWTERKVLPHPAWLLVWRNVHENAHFVAYPGSKDEKDFVEFYHSSSIVFQRESKKIHFYDNS
mmetsp:Transcript_10421/g.19070  ORF Transcript_10421/g.19070 Transcript_10421/m.19070 type:complete len:478 (-) Transcript_10421:19-1452(-)